MKIATVLRLVVGSNQINSYDHHPSVLLTTRDHELLLIIYMHMKLSISKVSPHTSDSIATLLLTRSVVVIATAAESPLLFARLKLINNNTVVREFLQLKDFNKRNWGHKTSLLRKKKTYCFV